jgi:hypothetical protein
MAVAAAAVLALLAAVLAPLLMAEMAALAVQLERLALNPVEVVVALPLVTQALALLVA